MGPIKRRTLGFAKLLLVMIFSMTLVDGRSLGADRALDKVNLILGGPMDFRAAGYLAALELGYFEEKGLDVSIKKGLPGIQQIQYVANRTHTFATANPTLVQAQMRGIPAVAIGLFFRRGMTGLLVHEESGIQSVHDLIEKRILFKSTTPDSSVLAMFATNGIELSQTQYMLSQNNALQSFRLNKTDAIVYNVFSGDPTTRFGFPSRLILPAENNSRMSTGFLYTSMQMIRDNPEKVYQFHAASVNGWKAIVRNPELVRKLFTKYTEFPEDRIAAIQALATPDQFIKFGVLSTANIGALRDNRIEKIAQVFDAAGIEPLPDDFVALNYDPVLAHSSLASWSLNSLVAVGFLICLSIALVMILLSRSRSLREVRLRNQRIIEDSQDILWEAELDGLAEAIFGVRNGGLTERDLIERHAELFALRFTFLSPAIADIYGYTVQEAMKLSLDTVMSEESEKHLDQQIARAIMLESKGEPASTITYESQDLHRDGSTVYTEGKLQFTYNKQGDPVGLEGSTRDITSRKLAEIELLKSESKYRALVENAPDHIVIVDEQGTIQYLNHAFEGIDAEDLIGHTVFDFIAEKYHPPIARALKAVYEERQPAQYEYFCDASQAWYSAKIGPVIENDTVTAAMQITRDITERVTHEKKQKLFLSELNHRVKNNLASVLSLSRQSIKSACSLEEFNEIFTHRLIAMTKTHETLASNNWQGIDLKDAVRLALSHQLEHDYKRIDMKGPKAQISPNDALPISLVLHELTTNALKHGALASSDHRISIHWLISDESHLTLYWKESNLQGLNGPLVKGVGLKLIEGLIGFQLQGEATFAIEADGFACTIRFDLDRHAPQKTTATNPRLQVSG